ncbi:hypothetical protein BDV06DRAFT_175147 [Aspergillus oleicola]
MFPDSMCPMAHSLGKTLWITLVATVAVAIPSPAPYQRVSKYLIKLTSAPASRLQPPPASLLPQDVALCPYGVRIIHRPMLSSRARRASTFPNLVWIFRTAKTKYQRYFCANNQPTKFSQRTK